MRSLKLDGKQRWTTMIATASSLSTVDQQIRSQLAVLQDSFSLIRHGSSDEGLHSFCKSWTALKEFCGAYSNIMQEETHFMVHSFSQKVDAFANILLEGGAASKAIHDEFGKEIAQIAEVDFKRLSIHDSPLHLPPTAQSRYIEPCYKWLLNHLHNPYPSRSMRSQISQQTGTPEKDIDAWFIDTRRRMGWNELRKAQFDSRTDMVKAATRFFKPSSRPVRSGPYNLPISDQLDSRDHSPEFASIEDLARSLYSDKFFPTTLATELPRNVKELAPHTKSQPKHNPQTSKQKDAALADPALSYPSPERSPKRPSDIIVLSSLSEVTVTPEKTRKRRNSDVESESGLERQEYQRPLKRSRVETVPIVDAGAISSLPSPAVSIQGLLPSDSAAPSLNQVAVTPSLKRKRHLSGANDEPTFLTDTDMPSSSTPLAEQSSASPAHKRKRRLSDADSNRPQKHPHNALSMPRLQTVSNPFPLSSASTNFFETWPEDFLSIGSNFITTIPDPVSTETLDEALPLQVECYDYQASVYLDDYSSQFDGTILQSDISPTSGPSWPISSQTEDEIAYTDPAGQIPGIWNGDHLFVGDQLQPCTIFDDISFSWQSCAPDAWQPTLSAHTEIADPTYQAPWLSEPSANVQDASFYALGESSPVNVVNSTVVVEPLVDMSLFQSSKAVEDPMKQIKFQYLQSMLAQVQLLKAELAI